VARNTRDCLNSLISRLDSIERSRRRIEQLLSQSGIRVRDAEVVYEALFLRSVVYFESLIEEVFMGLLTRAVNHDSAAVRPRINRVSHVAARHLVFGEKDYIDWLPFTRTEALATRFLAGGRPFTLLEDVTRQRLGQIIAIRNAITHRSAFAMRRSREQVLGSTPLPPKEKTPARYLRSVFRIAPPQTRFELFQIALRDSATAICG